MSVSSLAAEDRTGALTCAVLGRGCGGGGVSLVPSWSPTVARIERRSKADLVGLSSSLEMPVARADSDCPSLTSAASVLHKSIRGLASESAKMEELERLLSKFRLATASETKSDYRW